MPVVEWRHTVETSHLLRAVALAGFGAIGAMPLLLVLLALWLGVTTLAAGDLRAFGALLAVGFLVVVLAGRRLAPQIALHRRTEDGLRAWLPLRELAAASAAWLSLATLLAWLDVPFAVLYAFFAAGIFGCVPLVAALTSEGEVDTGAGELRVDGKTESLAAVDRVTRHDVGPVALLRIHYHDGAASFSSPRLLTVGRTDATRVRTALEAGISEPPESDRNPLVRCVLVAFGLTLLAAAAALGYYAVAAGGDATVVFLYGAAFAAVFGVLFLAVAAAEG